MCHEAPHDEAEAVARIERAGARALASHELLALLGIALDGPALAAAGGLRAVLDDPEHRSLLREDRARVQAFRELHTRWLETWLRRDGPLKHPELVRRFLQGRLRGLSREVFACLFLDQRLRLIAFETLFRGTVNGATVHKREVARRALHYNASALIAVHNHPSGCPEPSTDDHALTEALRATLALLDVRLVDHIVVGDGRCVSFLERGLL